MNSITLTGRLTKDPEVRQLESGTTVCQIRLAVDGLGRNNEVGYIDVASFGNGAKAAGETLTKGWLVGVSGRLEFRTYEKDGERRHTYQVVGHVDFLAAPRQQSSDETAEVPEPAAA
jgi:single-strand DNA-binding protein